MGSQYSWLEQRIRQQKKTSKKKCHSKFHPVPMATQMVMALLEYTKWKISKFFSSHQNPLARAIQVCSKIYFSLWSNYILLPLTPEIIMSLAKRSNTFFFLSLSLWETYIRWWCGFFLTEFKINISLRTHVVSASTNQLLYLEGSCTSHDFSTRFSNAPPETRTQITKYIKF